MRKNTARQKIALPTEELSVQIPKHAFQVFFKGLLEIVHDSGLDHIKLNDLVSDPKVVAFVKENILKEANLLVSEIGAYGLDVSAALDLFEEEFKLKEEEAKKANREEEERLKKEGRTMVIPLSEAGRAEAILRAAGVNVKLL